MHSIRFRCKSFALFRLFERSFYSKNFCNLSTREMTDIKRKVEEDFDNEHSNVHFKRSVNFAYFFEFLYLIEFYI